MNRRFLLPITLLLATSARAATAQELMDLLSGTKEEPKASGAQRAGITVGRDRVDLALSPSVRFAPKPERKTIGLSADLDLRMICGQFDLKATYQSLLGKEAREEFLEDLPDLLVQELLGSAMDLICQAEPTLCNLIQNYSISANLKASYYKDLCQAVEHALADAQKQSQADAVDACLKVKQAQGYPLDRAMELCGRKGPEVRNFEGQLVGELDLGKALRGILAGAKLSPGAETLVERLSEETRLGPGGGSSKIDPEAILGRYRDLEATYTVRLRELFEKARSRAPLRAEDLADAVPPEAPPLREDEVRRFARLLPEEEADVIASLAPAFAQFQLGREIHEVERALEALKGAPTVDEPRRQLLEDRLARLRREKRRVEELFGDHALVMGALARAKTLGDREYQGRVAAVQSKAGLGEKRRAHEAGTAPYGSLPAAPGRGAASPEPNLGEPNLGKAKGATRVTPKDTGCGSCTGEYSFGSTGSRPK